MIKIKPKIINLWGLDGDQISLKNEIETIFNVEKCTCKGALFAQT